MKPGPSNRNVSEGAWDEAMESHRQYLHEHAALMEYGLSDEEADAYIDARATLLTEVEYLDPLEMDFRVSDHTETLDTMREALDKMRELLLK